MEGSEARSPVRVTTVRFIGVTCMVFLWLVLTPGLFPSGQRVPIAFFFDIPIVGYASLWQNRLRKVDLFGDLPRSWSRASLSRVLGGKASYGQKVVYFGIALLGNLASSVAYHFPIVPWALDRLVPVNSALPLFTSALSSVTFAGMLAVLVGDNVAVYLLIEHSSSG